MSRQLSKGEFNTIVAHGPKADYVPTTDLAVPATIAASGNFTSDVQPADGYADFVFGITSSQAGAMTLYRYIDDGGTVALDSGQTVALVAATPKVLTVTDGLPCAAWVLKITNTGGSTATISNFAALASAH